MFEQAIVDGGKRSNPWSFAISVTVQSALVGAVLAIPLMHVAKLDSRLPDVIFLPRPIGRQEPIKQAAAKSTTSTAALVTQLNRTYKPFQAPTSVPKSIATGPDLPGAPIFDIGVGNGAGDPNGVSRIGLPDFSQKQLVPLPPPEPPRPVKQPAAPTAPQRVSAGVQAANLISAPRPVYPPLAKTARIQGTVRLAAEISSDGHIRNLRVISGHPMLVQSALDAVSQWVYKPTLLNGEPVEVLTDILVNFTLNQ